ncbi:hypothetical protein, partial [Lactobacillus amylovorus]|uniref:hypothetical protein n=1 Tax=Lactobacillus amylovorus TaxID=1604 RepID=UPI003F8B97D1
WYQRTLCSEACASFLMQKILLIEYHRNLSTGFIIEPFKIVLEQKGLIPVMELNLFLFLDFK